MTTDTNVTPAPIIVPLTPLAPGQTAEIPLGEIRPNLVALRPAQVESDKFAKLELNIKLLGAKQGKPGKILQPVRVRPKTDVQTGQPYYELVDGLQRFTVANRLGMETLPCRHEEDPSEDVDVLVDQLALNVTAVDTAPAQMSAQLHRVLEHRPGMSIAELAQMVGMSEPWVNQRLALDKLVPQIADEFVDTGLVTASNAYQLARLPAEEQLEFLSQAQSMTTAEFAQAVTSRLSEIRKLRAAGRDPKTRGEFTPVPVLRKAAEIRNAKPTDIPAVAEAKTPEDGAAATLAWVLQLDAESVAAAKARYEAAQRQKTEDAIKRQTERAAEMSQKAAERAAALRAELGI